MELQSISDVITNSSTEVFIGKISRGNIKDFPEWMVYKTFQEIWDPLKKPLEEGGWISPETDESRNIIYESLSLNENYNPYLSSLFDSYDIGSWKFLLEEGLLEGTLEALKGYIEKKLSIGPSEALVYGTWADDCNPQPPKWVDKMWKNGIHCKRRKG